MATMKAVVFKGKDRIAVEDVDKPTPRAGEAVIRITMTTICGTDVHIVRGEYPVRPGLVLGHEPVGVIDALGAGLDEFYQVGQRVIVGAITPCGQCFYCLNGAYSQCGGPLGGWRFGNTINGAWAEYLLVPDARAGGTLSSLGVYSGKLVAPYEALYAGLGDQKIVTTLCPGGKERMRRLMAMIDNRRVDLTPLVTHHFALDDIQEAFDLFSQQRDGVLKVALYPDRRTMTSAKRVTAAAAM